MNQRSISNPLVMLGPFLGVVLSLAVLPGHAQATGERTTSFLPGVPVRTLLKPTDTVLTLTHYRLEDGLTPTRPDGPRPTLADAVDHLVAADALVLGRITNRTSRLSELADWLESTFSMQVERVLKAAPSLTVGDLLTFDQTGGELTIDGRLVRAVPSFERPYEPGERYLVPLRRSATGLLPGPSVFQFINGKVFELEVRVKGDARSPVDGGGAAAVLALIEARVKSLSQESERVVPSKPGVSLHSRILPTDKVLVVRTNMDEAHVLRGTDKNTSAAAAVAEMVKEADALVLATVVGRQSQLTRYEDWMESIHYLRVDRVFSSKVPVDVGGMFHVHQSGGELMLGGCLVKVLPPGERPYTAGKRYLIPLRKMDTMLQFPTTAVAFELDGNLLIEVNGTLPGRPGSPLNRAVASEVFAMIEKLSKR